MAENVEQTPAAPAEEPQQQPSGAEEATPEAAAAAAAAVEDKPAAADVKENGTEAAAAAVPEAEPAKEMRAVVLSGFGGLKTVKILRKPEPAPADGEILVRVKACGLNFQDLMVRQGAIDQAPKCPFILGCECAGVVEQIAEGVEGFEIGDRVVALPEFRAWAELVSVPAKYVYKLPEGLSFADAAAMTMNYAVAYILLFEMAGLSQGKSLLLHSAGGGVGQAVVQLARTVPDVTVFGVCSKGKHEALKANATGIDHLLERGTDYSSEVRKVRPEGVDVVLDCLCGEECNRGYNLLKPMGRYILYGSSNAVSGETKSIFSAARSWWQVDKVSPMKLFDDNKSIAGFNLRHLMYKQGESELVRAAIAKVFGLFGEQKIKPVADSTWAFEDVTEAMQKLHDRKNIGKIVLDPNAEPKPKPVTPAKGKDKKQKQSSEEKKDEDKKEGGAAVAAVPAGGDDKKDSAAAEKKEEEEVLTNGDSAGESGDSKDKDEEKASS